MEVSNNLGRGFLEKVYERSLFHELRTRGHSVACQVPVQVTYKGNPVGHYVTDLVVDNRIPVELKCVSTLAPEHIAQVLNYLKASNLPVALLINFQSKTLQWRRLILQLP
jgi:GxxExxY protein